MQRLEGSWFTRNLPYLGYFGLHCLQTWLLDLRLSGAELVRWPSHLQGHADTCQESMEAETQSCCCHRSSICPTMCHVRLRFKIVSTCDMRDAHLYFSTWTHFKFPQSENWRGRKPSTHALVHTDAYCPCSPCLHPFRCLGDISFPDGSILCICFTCWECRWVSLGGFLHWQCWQFGHVWTMVWSLNPWAKWFRRHSRHIFYIYTFYSDIFRFCHVSHLFRGGILAKDSKRQPWLSLGTSSWCFVFSSCLYSQCKRSPQEFQGFLDPSWPVAGTCWIWLIETGFVRDSSIWGVWFSESTLWYYLCWQVEGKNEHDEPVFKWRQWSDSSPSSSFSFTLSTARAKVESGCTWTSVSQSGLEDLDWVKVWDTGKSCVRTGLFRTVLLERQTK